MVLLVMLAMLLKVEWNLLVSSKESVEAWHSVSLDLTFTVDIKVIPGLIEVFIQIFFRLFSLEAHMSLKNFFGMVSSGSLVVVEFTSWLSCISSSLSGVVLESIVHELIISFSWSCKSLWDLPVVSSKTFFTFETILGWWVTWMWVVLIPGSGNTIVSSCLNLVEMVGDTVMSVMSSIKSSKESCNNYKFHFDKKYYI